MIGKNAFAVATAGSARRGGTLHAAAAWALQLKRRSAAATDASVDWGST
ncbi:hypothetical protein [Mycobacterium talmoniae]|uniref:Uncharacterized protein n=1 Tax=Mycobacterium talmoniae TaxID=1858794 RepID=A0A2S8BJE1_9MYCO|nr:MULTISPECIES: hypothetical protein [Mycobacterium]PQM46794.1 hypothetical protein C1Y40_03033 [Mycobacterium talmoniae]